MDSKEKKNLELLNQLGQLLIFGSSSIAKTEIHLKKTRLKKQLLYLQMGAVQSYSESILKLVTPPNIYEIAAEVLLRCIVEAYINIIFIYTGRSEKNARTFLIDSIEDRVKFAKRHHLFWDKYPNWNLEFGNIKSACEWDEFILSRKNEIHKIRKRYKFNFRKEMPKLLMRAIEHDNELKNKKRLTSENSLEKYYVLFYQYFSDIAHLKMKGLERFMKTDNTGKTRLDIDGTIKNIDAVLAVTYVTYMLILRHFLKEFNIYNKNEFKKYTQFSRSMNKK